MKLTYYTDGGCEPNPGKGAWAFVCVETSQTGRGVSNPTTSNKMEIMAILEAAKHALQSGGTEILIISDSQYCVKGFNIWMAGWQRNNWMKKDGYSWVQVKNCDLWQRMYELRGKISLTWVKGHAGNQWNEQCDYMVKSLYSEVFGGVMKF